MVSAMDLSKPAGDLAEHFMECGKLNTNLTLAPGDRLVITDDLLDGTVANLAALSMAAVVARDTQVGRAAILPLGLGASRLTGRDRARYERLFELIEQTAFDPQVRESAQYLLAASFREAEIRDLAAELDDCVGPARERYRAFLDIIRLMTERRISEPMFLDEFLSFTQTVAGKLDFGIYVLCVDRIFESAQIPILVKTTLLREICHFPNLVRKELITNIMASNKVDGELVRHCRQEIDQLLARDQVTEMLLLTMLKRSWAARKQSPLPASL